MLSDDDDPFGSLGLQPIGLADKATFDQFFRSCPTPLSDYSFANTYIWRDSIHLRWRVLRDCLCVFANGDGGLTMLFPPVGDAVEAAARDAMDICRLYNARQRIDARPRIEYVSSDMLQRIGAGYDVAQMSGDYVYATQRMITLEGGDLASKRQARNRFERRYQPHTEAFGPQHAEACIALLETWREQSDQAHAGMTSAQLKRCKEVAATTDVIRLYRELGLTGMVVWAGGQVVGFTFGEMLSPDTCSILVEKTDRQMVGSANYIFNEFCRQAWSHTAWCNVGDDWEIPGLAWTKQSYRPAYRLDKFVLHPAPVTSVPVAMPAAAPAVELAAQQPPEAAQVVTQQASAAAGAVLDAAAVADLDALLAMEHSCFAKPVAISRRQFRYLLRSPRATVRVLREDGRIVGQALVLRRRCAGGTTGRLYSLAIDQSQRGKGYGRMLLGDCLRMLRDEGVSGVWLEVDTENAPAVGLYEAMGFRKVRLLRDYYAAGKHAWKMKLELADVPAAAGTDPAHQARTSQPAELLVDAVHQ
jgi:ribosomal protein S18 acetylase RimI-like enzyme